MELGDRVRLKLWEVDVTVAMGWRKRAWGLVWEVVEGWCVEMDGCRCEIESLPPLQVRDPVAFRSAHPH